MGQRTNLTIVFSAIAAVALPIIAIDNWLPYALLSHQNLNVDPNPPELTEQNITYETFSIQSEAGYELTGWYVPAIDSSPNSSPTVIALHGLGGTREHMLRLGIPLWQGGANVVLVDLRSHGESGGSLFTYGAHEQQDISDVVDWLEETYPGTTDELSLVGFSVGGAVAIAAAARDERIDRLVTINTFADLHNTIADNTGWLPNFWRNRAIARAESLADFDSAEIAPHRQLAQVTVPTLVIHGDGDQYIPFVNGQRLADANRRYAQLIPIADANHINIMYGYRDELMAPLLNFLGLTPPSIPTNSASENDEV